MNIKDKIKLNFYPELKELNIDGEMLKQIISNKNFKKQYKTYIKYEQTKQNDEKVCVAICIGMLSAHAQPLRGRAGSC